MCGLLVLISAFCSPFRLTVTRWHRIPDYAQYARATYGDECLSGEPRLPWRWALRLIILLQAYKLMLVLTAFSLVKGLNDAWIIDDSYNANPVSMRAAIEVLAGVDGEKILVMGDMLN